MYNREKSSINITSVTLEINSKLYEFIIEIYYNHIHLIIFNIVKIIVYYPLYIFKV